MPQRNSAIANPAILKVVTAGLVTLLFVAVWVKNITDSPIMHDATENLQLAINLQHNHTYSVDERAPYHPSMVREPVPVLTIALAVKVVDAVLGPAEPRMYLQGTRARLVKLQNVVWMALLCLTVYYSIYSLSSSFYLGLLGVVLINKVPLVTSGLVYGTLLIDTLYTEIPAATLLLLGSTLLAQGAKRSRSWLIVGAGLSFGALALTKAAFLYVFFGMLTLLIAVALCRRSRATEGWPDLRQLLVLSLGFFVMVVPWLIRNYEEVGSLQIAGRGGLALYERAVYDDMTNDELRATLYWWAPDSVTQWIFGRALDLSAKDFLHRDSPLRRLSKDPDSDFYDEDVAAMQAGTPEKAISFYFKSYGDKQQLLYGLEASGVANPDVVADKLVSQRALTIMRTHPLRQLLMVPLFMYRAAAYLFLALTGALVYVLKKQRWDLVIMVIPGMLLLLLYASLTDYITRYAVLVRPLAIVVILLALQAGWNEHRRQIHGPRAAAS